jgi:predicted HD phosphohydrolase
MATIGYAAAMVVRARNARKLPLLEAGENSPLGRPDWTYVDKPDLDAFTAADWQVLDRQRLIYDAEQRAAQALRMLAAMADDTTFGYAINNYRHCLQSATMALRDGHDEETVVVALFHDIGFITCPETHGAFAAALLGPLISDRNIWMLEHHDLFQGHHIHDHPDVDPNVRERWRGHPHFDWTAEYVAKYDQNAISATYENAPLEAFVPMVNRVFARPPKIRPRD